MKISVTPETVPIPIHVYADVVCPWCYVGKRRLDKAVEMFRAEGGQVEVTLLPFQLDPEAAQQPAPLMEALSAKFGGSDQAAQSSSHITDIAAAEGLEFDFDAAVSANTLRAHRLLHRANQQSSDAQARLAEAIMTAHFSDGLDINSIDVLVGLARDAQIDLDVRAYLESDEDLELVNELQGEARAMGITSVPTFVFAGRWGLSGAQEPETLLTVLRQVAGNLSGAEPVQSAGGGCCGGGCCG